MKIEILSQLHTIIMNMTTINKIVTNIQLYNKTQLVIHIV